MTTGFMQLGKNGVTDSFIECLKTYFKTHENMKISVLKNARNEREDVKKYSKEIVEKLGKFYTTKTIGFTIIVKKWRKARA